MSYPCAPPSSSPNSWVPRGTVLGARYRLEGVIAGGGMGVVYRGLHLESGRSVAIKVLRREHTQNPSAKTRFLREARTLGRFRSPHLPRLLDVGEHESGMLYMVLELLTGSDLRRVLNRQEFGVADAVDIVLQICEAVAEPHANAIVHRDIKPENIVFASEAGPNATVKLVDFGIAKDATSERNSWVSRKHTLGSPEYMAPEQFIAPDHVDHRADVWSIGAVLYELLVGMPPPRARRNQGQPPILVLPPMPPQVPSPLEAAVSQMLASSPDQRPANVAELARLLGPFATDDGRQRAARLANVDVIAPWIGSALAERGSPGRSGVFIAPVVRVHAHGGATMDSVKTLDVSQPASEAIANR